MDSLTRAREARLAIRCQLGESGAFTELVREMEPRLLYLAAKLTGSEALAFDVLQETWLDVYRKIRRLEDPGALRGWLCQIVRARAVSRMRGNASRERAEEALATEAELNDPGPTFDDEDAAEVHAALDEIPLPQREVLTLHFFEELQLEEIARIVGAPLGTVKSRLHYGKRALRAALGRKSDEH